MLAKLQAEQAEEARLRAERDHQERNRRELERQKHELEREKERAERERKELQEQRRRAREEAEHMSSAEVKERNRQKERLLARMKEIDDGTATNSDVAAPATSQAAVNGPTSTNKRSAAADDDVNAVFGEYRPSFLAGTTSSTKTKKPAAGRRRDTAVGPPSSSNLLVFDDLAKPADEEKPPSPDLSFLSSQPSMGAAGDRNSKHLLPRRPRQQATTVNGSGASVGVVGDTGDDIEEMIL